MGHAMRELSSRKDSKQRTRFTADTHNNKTRCAP